MEAVPIWRVNSLTWWLAGGACEPPRRAATTGGTGAVQWARKRPRSSPQEVTKAIGRWSSHMRGTLVRAMGN